MKSLLIYLILFQYNHYIPLFGQNIGFEKIIDTDRNNTAADMIETESSYIFLVNSRVRNSFEMLDRNQLKILRLDRKGTILGEKTILSIDSLNSIGIKFLRLNQRYFALGFIGKPNYDCTFGKFFVLTLDEEFNLLNQVTTEYHGEYVFQVFADVIKNKIVAGVSLKTCDDNLAYTEFYKIDENGNVLTKNRHQVSFDGFQPFSICESLDHNGYVATGWVNYKLDSNLNLIKYDQEGFFNLLNSNACTVLRWDDRQYLFSYSTNEYGGKYGLRFIDKDFKTLKDKSLGNDSEVELIPNGTSVSFVDRNAIYLTGFIYKSPFGKFPQYPIVAKVDSNLNVIWEKIYLSDMLTMVWNSKATNDGGVMLMGQTEKIGQPSNAREFYSYILKVDRDGNLSTSNEDHFKLDIPNITIYPNQSGYLKIMCEGSFDDKISLLVNDLSGKILFRKTDLVNDETIDLSSLPPDIYVYTIVKENQLLKSAKWLKSK